MALNEAKPFQSLSDAVALGNTKSFCHPFPRNALFMQDQRLLDGIGASFWTCPRRWLAVFWPSSAHALKHHLCGRARSAEPCTNFGETCAISAHENCNSWVNFIAGNASASPMQFILKRYGALSPRIATHAYPETIFSVFSVGTLTFASAPRLMWFSHADRSHPTKIAHLVPMVFTLVKGQLFPLLNLTQSIIPSFMVVHYGMVRCPT